MWNFQDYAQGFDCYISGDWQSAKRIFAKCKKQKPDDIHVQRILKFMVRNLYSRSILNCDLIMPGIHGLFCPINLERISTFRALKIQHCRGNLGIGNVGLLFSYTDGGKVHPWSVLCLIINLLRCMSPDIQNQINHQRLRDQLGCTLRATHPIAQTTFLLEARLQTQCDKQHQTEEIRSGSRSVSRPAAHPLLL